MTNLEKAKEIVSKNLCMDAIIGMNTVRQVALCCCRQMAEWKDEQHAKEIEALRDYIKQLEGEYGY